jgi:PAS domain S-box-containing protein
MKLRPWFLASLVAALTVSLGGLVWWQAERSQALMRQQVLAQAEQRSVQLADAMAGQIGGLLSSIDLALRQLRQEWDGDAHHFDAKARAILGALPPGAVSHVTAVGADGYVVYNSLNNLQRTYVGDREHFRAHLSGADRLVIGKPVLSRLGNTWTFIVNRPILRNGSFAGTMNLSVSSEYLSNKLAALQLSGNDLIALLHADGSFMARSQDFLKAMGSGVTQNRPFLAPGAAAQGVYKMPGTFDQTSRIYAWHRLDEYGLITAIGLAEDAVLAPLAAGMARDRTISSGLVALVAVFGGFIVVLLLRVARGQSETQMRLRRIERQQASITELAVLPAVIDGDVEAVMRFVTEKTAAVLATERTSIWLFDEPETTLVCHDLFQATLRTHSAGEVLYESAYQDEFHALKTSKYVDASDPCTDPRTAGYVADYLRPLHITAMLDAIIQAGGKHYGVLCFEHVGSNHRWESDEIAFACQVADQLTLTIQNNLRRKTEAALREKESLLAEAQQVAHLGNWNLDLSSGKAVWSDEEYRLLGHHPGSVEPGAESFMQAVHPDDRDAVWGAMQRAMDPSQHASYHIEHRVVGTAGERIVEERGHVTFNDQGQPVRMFGITMDITERKRAEASLQRLNDELEARVEMRTMELTAAKDEAERASLAKSDFLSRMSHELRTPMNAILGFSQLLQSDPGHPLAEVQSDSVQEILHAGGHLLDLINEVLDLARIESGKFTVSQEPVPLMPLLSECLTLMRPQAEARGIRIVEAGRDCGENVLADRVRLKQVLLNLLSNAVKYNCAQGTLSLACMRQGDAIQIRISDTGVGLTAEQQARLFVAFERLDADTTAIEGTGIGLALSKRLTELMHGEIGVESTPGSGSTFWVRFPLVDGHAEEPHDAAASVSEDQVGHPVSQQRWDVLCIEDNPANLRLIERILARRADIRLLTASAPGLGLELAQAHRPALILLDINLPDMDGYAVMQCLRESAATRDIPVVAISANAMPKDLARGKAAGFLDYLTKPLEVGRLLRVVDDLIGKPVSIVAGMPNQSDFSGEHTDE